jgi:hypothetical protein
MMTKTAVQKAVAYLLSAATLMGAVAPAASWAANNRLSNVQRIASTDGAVLEALDLTLNTSWDYDANVTQLGTGVNGVAARTLNRAYVEALVRQAARTLFVMTNGRHRIGKVYVFKNGRFGNDVDVKLLNVEGRSNASPAGWRAEGGLTTDNFVTNKVGNALVPELPEETGEVVAHELGHYVYGLLDEYREDGKPCLAPAVQAGSPCQSDIVKPTAMNNQELSYRLSVPSDYAGLAAYGTAQARGYGTADGGGSSAWEMLVSDPANDTAVAKEVHGGRRIRFDAFKNMAVPTLAQLKQFGVTDENKAGRFDGQRGTVPSNAVFAGYDSQLQLIYDEGGQVESQPRNVIIVDRTVPEATFRQFIETAQGLINRAPASARFALVGSPSSGTPQFLDMSAAGKGTLKGALEQLTRVDDGFDLNAAYAEGKALVTAARAAGGGVENAADTDTFSLLTASTTAVPADLGTTARNDKIAINPIGFSRTSSRAMPLAANSLATLARDSGGTHSTAKSVGEAIKDGDKALKEAMGDSEALIASDLSDDVLAAGATHEVRFKVGPVALDGTVMVNWYFDKADQAKLRFSCVSAVNGQTVLPVIQTNAGSDEGQATCTIGAGRAVGDWIARVGVANGAGTASSVETEVVATPAGGIPVELGAGVAGGLKSDNRRPHLTVKLAGAFPVIRAKVLVDVFNATDGTLLKQFTLTEANDAGTGGDGRASDGIYTLDLGGQLPAGTYVALVDAATTTDSMFNPVQIFAAGTSLQATSVGGEIARQTEVEFTLEAGATGVGVETAVATPPGATPPATTPTATAPATATAATDDGRSGGCTVGNGSDAGLLVLLGLAGSMLMLRRGRRAMRRIRGD